MTQNHKEVKLSTHRESTPSSVSLLIGVVDFKTCIDKSLIGKKDRAIFEEMKKNMNLSLQKKQTLLQETHTKLNDSDYLNSLPKQAQTELEHNFHMMRQELEQQEEQCYRILEQHNNKAMQKMQDLTKKAAEIIAKQEGLQMMINREALFYYEPQQDKTDLVIIHLDKVASED